MYAIARDLAGRLFVALVALSSIALLAGVLAVPARAQTADTQSATEKLFEAVHDNDFDAVQASIAAGATVDSPNRWGMTAVDIAVDKGYFRIAHYLVAVRNFGREAERANAQSQDSAGDDRHAPANAPSRSGRSTATATPSTQSPMSSQAVIGSASQPVYGSVIENETKLVATKAQAWPADKPNPFDPSTPAPGSRLLTVDKIGTAAGGPLFQSVEEAKASDENSSLPRPQDFSSVGTAAPNLPDVAKER